MLTHQNNNNNNDTTTTLPDIEAAKAIVLLHQHEEVDHEDDDDVSPSTTTTSSTILPLAAAKDDSEAQQLIKNEPSSSVPVVVAQEDKGNDEAAKEDLTTHQGTGGDQEVSVTTASAKNLHTQSSDSVECEHYDTIEPARMSKKPTLAPLDVAVMDDSAPQPERDDDRHCGITTTTMTLPTSPMTCTKKPRLLQSGMKRSWSSPTHHRAVGQKGPTKKFKTNVLIGRNTTADVASSKLSSTNNNIQQQQQACNVVDLTMDDPSYSEADDDDDDDEAGTTTPTTRRSEPEQQRVGGGGGGGGGFDSPEMQFIHLIAQKLTGRPQETFKAIAAKVMDYHSRHLDTMTYENLPRAILLHVKERMEPSEYMGAYAAARAEWSKRSFPNYPPTMQRESARMAHLADPRNNNARNTHRVAIRPGMAATSGMAAVPSRNATQHRIAAAAPSRHHYAAFPPQNPPNNHRNVAIVSENSLRIYSPTSRAAELTHFCKAPKYFNGSVLPTRNNNNNNHHHDYERHRSVPSPVPTNRSLSPSHGMPNAPTSDDDDSRYSSSSPPQEATAPPPRASSQRRSERVSSSQQQPPTSRGPTSRAATAATTLRQTVVSNVKKPPITISTVRTIAPTEEVPAGTTTGTTTNNNKSAMQLSLRFGYAICLKQLQRRNRLRRRSSSSNHIVVALSVEEMMEKAERKLNTMTPAERDQLWDEIQEFTEEESGL